MVSRVSSTMGLSDVELAAEFIRRAAFVDANALLKDECGVEGECEELRSGRMTISLVSSGVLLPPPPSEGYLMD